MTSHDVVAQVRHLTKIRQIGHGGTLDRLATGVLPVAIGSACRLIRFINTDKCYLAEVMLGKRTTTDDLEGDVVEEKSVPKHLPVDQLKEALKEFVGVQKQIPPAYSAIHYQGKRLYELARQNNLPDEIQPRQVHIRNIELIDVADNLVRIRVECSGGTYIRSLARDLGSRLGYGGCISLLERERSGPFILSESISLEQLSAFKEKASLHEHIIDPLQALNMQTLTVNQLQAWQIATGQALDLETFSLNSSNGSSPDLMAIKFGDQLVAICSARDDSKLYPEVVIADAKSLAR